MLPLRGNVLDVAFVQAQDSWTLIVSIDNVYKPGSTTELQDDQVSTCNHASTMASHPLTSLVKTIPRLQYFSKQPNGQWREDDSLASKLQWFVHQGSEVQTETKGDSKDAKGVRDILYSVGNLRKRPGADAED